MKHCPACGAELPTPNSAFCPECGTKLSGKKAPSGKHAKPTPRHGKQAKKSPDKKRKKSPSVRKVRQDAPYDGYYDDVLPVDDGEYRQGLDPKTLKNIGMLLAGVLFIVTLCIVALYLM